MLRHHHLEQLPVEPIRARLDLVEVEARLEVEIVAARAVLEIEVDQAGVGLGSVLALEQQHRGLDRERGQPDAAGRGQERVDLRLGRAAAALRALRGARAGAHQVERRDRLHDEIRDAHLQQLPRHRDVECRDRDDHRRQRRRVRCVSAFSAAKSASLAGSMSTITTVAPFGVELAHRLGERAGRDRELDLGVHAERRAQQAFEVGVAALCHDARLRPAPGLLRANIAAQFTSRPAPRPARTAPTRSGAVDERRHLVGAVALRGRLPCARRRCAMLRSPARTGHGSTMWVTLLAATASPAPKLTVSRRSRYMSVQAPSSVVAASARTREATYFARHGALPWGRRGCDRSAAPSRPSGP